MKIRILQVFRVLDELLELVLRAGFGQATRRPGLALLAAAALVAAVAGTRAPAPRTYAPAPPFDLTGTLARARAGSAEDQYRLARKLAWDDRSGHGSARLWLERAALQGHVPAEIALGRLLVWNGQASLHDKEIGASWMRRAAGSGDPAAMRHLAYMCLAHDAPGLDPADAPRWMRAAADAGDGLARYEVYSVEAPACWPLWTVVLIALTALACAGRAAPELPARGWWSFANRRAWLAFAALWFAAWALALAGVDPLRVFGQPVKYLAFWVPLVVLYAADPACRFRAVYQASLAFLAAMLLYMVTDFDYASVRSEIGSLVCVQGLLIGLVSRRAVLASALGAGLILMGCLVGEHVIPVLSWTLIAAHAITVSAQTALWACAARLLRR